MHTYDAQNLKALCMHTHRYKQRSTCLDVNLQQNGQSCNHNTPSVSTGGRQRAHLFGHHPPNEFCSRKPIPVQIQQQTKKVLTACKSQQEDQEESNTGVISYLNQTDQIYHVASAIQEMNGLHNKIN